MDSLSLEAVLERTTLQFTFQKGAVVWPLEQEFGGNH
jgi:hypothetical protein